MANQATMRARFALRHVRQFCRASTGRDYQWHALRSRYAFDINPNRADGGLDGVIWNDDGPVGRRVGRFEIRPDGVVTKWPGLPTGVREEAKVQADANVRQCHPA